MLVGFQVGEVEVGDGPSDDSPGTADGVRHPRRLLGLGVELCLELGPSSIFLGAYVGLVSVRFYSLKDCTGETYSIYQLASVDIFFQHVPCPSDMLSFQTMGPTTD